MHLNKTIDVLSILKVDFFAMSLEIDYSLSSMMA